MDRIHIRLASYWPWSQADLRPCLGAHLHGLSTGCPPRRISQRMWVELRASRMWWELIAPVPQRPLINRDICHPRLPLFEDQGEMGFVAQLWKWTGTSHGHTEAMITQMSVCCVLMWALSPFYPMLCRFNFSTWNAKLSFSVPVAIILTDSCCDLQIGLVSRLTALNSPPLRSWSGVSKKEVYLQSVCGLWWKGLSGLIGPCGSGCNVASDTEGHSTYVF